MAAHWHTHIHTHTHSFKFQFQCHIWHRKYCLMKPSIRTRSRFFSELLFVSLFGWLCTMNNSNFSANCYAMSVSHESPSANGNANTIRTKQSIELDATIATSSLNTLFGSRLDKPSAGHHNCVELEKQPDDVRETSSAVLYSEHSRDRQLKLGIHSIYLVFYAVRSSNIEWVWR